MQIAPTSRYFATETRQLERPDGSRIAYLARRLVPSPDRFATLGVHVVGQNERLDHIAFRHLGDAEQFWRICDANAALRPAELTERLGRALRITLPEGIAGPPRA